MLQVKGNDLYISYGDTLDVIFRVVGFEVELTDKIRFTVKDEVYDKEPLVEKEFTNIEGTDINIVLSSEEMKKINVGTNYYDLLCIKEDNKVTLNFPAKLVVERVVHNE